MLRARKAARYLLIALGVVVLALIGVVTGFIKSEHLPEGIRFVADNPLPAFGVLVVVAALLEVSGRVLEHSEQGQEKTTEFTPQLRTNLLEVLGARYKRRLEDPREQEVWLELGLKETPQALAPDPNLRLVGSRESRAVDRSKTIEDLFDEAGRLLILGEPGAGKTTMLLQLALGLIERAEEDSSDPIPVVVNLASWARHGGSIREWLVEDALQTQANVGQEDLARTLIEDNHLLLLLDGLDEIEEARREGCVAAINDYLVDRPGRVVVCSRKEEYEQTGDQLALEKAVQIEPLQPDQVIRELEQHSGTEGLLEMLREDDLLRELATTPLNVSVMVLAYGEKPASEVHAASKGERRRILWDDYVTRMIARKPTEYAPKNILSWLSWLATKMRQDDMTRFIPDRMQPTWLNRSPTVEWIICLVFGLATGLASGLASGLGAGLVLGMVFGLGFWLIGVIIELDKGVESIHLVENLSWDWDHVAVKWKHWLGGGLALGLGGGLVNGLGGGLVNNLIRGLVIGLGSGLTLGLTELVETALVTSAIETAQFPGDRLHASRRNGLLKGLSVGMASGVGFGLTFGLLAGVSGGLINGLVIGLGFGLASGLPSGIIFRNGDVLKFDILRFLLWREGAIPWRYFDFLKQAYDLLLLKQVGGAVEFRHLLLRDYFAELTPKRIEELSARIEHISPG